MSTTKAKPAKSKPGQITITLMDAAGAQIERVEIPRALFATIARAAKAERITVQQWIIAAVREKVSRHEARQTIGMVDFVLGGSR